MSKILLQIGGVFIFVALVSLAIIFASGYQYDIDKRDFVKKGVVYFEGLVTGDQKPELLLNGNPVEFSLPGEFRIEPGAYDIEIRNEGYFPWKKKILVPEEEVLRFPEIRLFPLIPPSFSYVLEPLKNFVIQYSSERGVFLYSPKFHFGKYYFLNPTNKFWIKDIPIKAQILKFAPFSADKFLGLTKERLLFLYDFVKQTYLVRENFYVNDIKPSEDSIYLLDKEARIWKMTVNDVEPALFFDTDANVQKIKRIQRATDNILFLFDSVAVVAKSDGAIVFQQQQIDSAYLSGEKLYYSKGAEFFKYDMTEKKIISQRDTKERFEWLSRIGNTFHFLFLTKDLELKYCDEDFENCHSITKLDMPFIESSVDENVFFVSVNGSLTAFDFEESGSLQQFLQNLVSFLWRKS